MSDPTFYLTIAAATLAGVAMLTFAALNGWRDWLRLKHQQMAQDQFVAAPTGPSAGSRIEIADLRERIRKLEAIAAGVDL
ncbi:hypothetical protein [Sphingomonas sp.]|uniref:hypothetical protein n=1 Tax=Sphingomonas sp. TaxID=28214 RepID=UPI0035C82BF8